MIIAIVKLGNFIPPRNSHKRFLVIPFCLRSLAFLKETPEDLILFQRISFSWVIKTSVKVWWNTWLKGPFLLCLKQVRRVALCLDVGSLVCNCSTVPGHITSSSSCFLIVFILIWGHLLENVYYFIVFRQCWGISIVFLLHLGKNLPIPHTF